MSFEDPSNCMSLSTVVPKSVKTWIATEDENANLFLVRGSGKTAPAWAPWRSIAGANSHLAPRGTEASLWKFGGTITPRNDYANQFSRTMRVSRRWRRRMPDRAGMRRCGAFQSPLPGRVVIGAEPASVQVLQAASRRSWLPATRPSSHAIEGRSIGPTLLPELQKARRCRSRLSGLNH